MFDKFDVGDVVVNIFTLKAGILEKFYIYDVEDRNSRYEYFAENKRMEARISSFNIQHWEIYTDELIDQYAEYLI